MPSFEHEVPLDISASSMWAGLKDQRKNFPKIMPDLISSIDVVQGEGAPGTVRMVKFGPKVLEGGFVKERVVSVDPDRLTAVSEEVEGGHLKQFGMSKWVQTFSIIPAGENASKLHVKCEYEGGSDEASAKCQEQAKHELSGMFTAMAKYVKENIKST